MTVGEAGYERSNDPSQLGGRREDLAHANLHVPCSTSHLWQRRTGGRGGVLCECFSDTVINPFDDPSQVANMIYKGYMKGYISHGMQMVVLSKANAFPRLVERPAPYSVL